MRLSLERWDALTKHANADDRAWTNRDVRELVEYATQLHAEATAYAATATHMNQPLAALARAEQVLRDQLVNRVGLADTLGVHVVTFTGVRGWGPTLPDAYADLLARARPEGP